jgi:hypothetical protein
VPPRQATPDQVARGQIGDRMPTHDAPEQTDDEPDQ